MAGSSRSIAPAVRPIVSGSSTPAIRPSGSSSSIRPGISGISSSGGCLPALRPGSSGFSTSPDVGTSGTGNSARAELSGLFNWNPNYRPSKKRKASYVGKGSKRKKLPSWTHTWVCLAQKGDQHNPDPEERSVLQLAGLGEKRFPILLHSDAQDIHAELLEQFPKLEKAGGYELLRLGPGGIGNLQLIKPPPNGYSVEYLRPVVGSAKIFIRPFQQDLDIDSSTLYGVRTTCTTRTQR